ncbi:MAG: hypothetical protein SNG35_00455 [Rikenellaceae bacterium]
MNRFISKVLTLMAVVVVFASCEVRRWEEVPVEYRTVYVIDYGESLSDGQDATGMSGVYKYHLYFDCEPYALLTFSDDTVIESVTEIYDFVDGSAYPDGETTYHYSFSFKEKVYTRNADGSITLGVREYKIDGDEDSNVNNTSSEVLITDVDTSEYGGEEVARVYTLTRPYENGFIGYDEYSIDLME